MEDLFFNSPEIPSFILSEFLWSNRLIKIDNEPVFFKHFSEHGINFVYQPFDKNGVAKKWEILQTEYKLDNSFHFQWCQLIYALPESWKKPSIFLKILTIFYYALIITLPENLEYS